MHFLHDGNLVNKERTTKILPFNEIKESEVLVIRIDDNPRLKGIAVIITSKRLLEFYKRTPYKRKRWYLLDKNFVIENSNWDGK